MLCYPGDFAVSLFGPALKSVEEHAGPPGAGDHGQKPRCEGCLRRPGRQQDEEQGLKEVWPEKGDERKEGQGMAWRSEMRRGRGSVGPAGTGA